MKKARFLNRAKETGQGNNWGQSKVKSCYILYSQFQGLKGLGSINQGRRQQTKPEFRPRSAYTASLQTELDLYMDLILP
jgi:hypothetical protein